MTIEVRLGTEEDLEEVAELHKASISKLCAAHYTPAQLASWAGGLTLEGYKALLRTKTLFVATEAGEVRGFGVLDLKASIVNATYVNPSAAGKGLGRALVEEMERVAQEHGLSQLMLHATLNAVEFYEARGFIRGEESTNRLPSGAELPCVVMTKPLRGHRAGEA